MKHRPLIPLVVLNQLSAGALGLALGVGILWLFSQIGMFRGLKSHHYIFILLCVILAMAAGYYAGSL